MCQKFKQKANQDCQAASSVHLSLDFQLIVHYIVIICHVLYWSLGFSKLCNQEWVCLWLTYLSITSDKEIFYIQLTESRDDRCYKQYRNKTGWNRTYGIPQLLPCVNCLFMWRTFLVSRITINDDVGPVVVVFHRLCFIPSYFRTSSLLSVNFVWNIFQHKSFT